MNAAYSSLGSLLEELRGLFPPALTGDSGWERLEALTERLPIYTTDARFGFEFDLCDASTTADFCAVVPPGSRTAAFYQDYPVETAPCLAGPGFGAFLTQQGDDPHSLLARTAATIILEYDLAHAAPGRHGPPGIFIVPRNPSERAARQVHDTIHDDPAGLVAALESAAGWEQGVVDMLQVERVWAAMAGAGIVAHAGVMPGRGQRAIRLIIQAVQNTNVAGMLERLQWNGDSSLAVSTLSDLAGLVKPQTGLSIDVTAQGVSPRLGLELFRPIEWYQTDRAGWKLLFDRLVEKEWCLQTRANGLAEWPGIEFFFGRDGVYKIRQTVNHIKLVIERGTVRVKGYAGMDVLRAS